MSDFIKYATETEIAEISQEDPMLVEIEKDKEQDNDVENTRNQWASTVHDLMFRK